MNQDIATFLTASRKFRAAQSRGPVLLVEKDPWIRKVVESWLLQQGSELISCSSMTEADAWLVRKPKCVIFGIDGQSRDETMAFLRRIDKEYPSTISVAVTGHLHEAVNLNAVLPRVTVICKGEGLEEALNGLFPPNGKAKA